MAYRLPPLLSFFFFNDPATTEIYTLSLHDALPICSSGPNPYSNFAVVRLKESLWPGSYVGLMGIDKRSGNQRRSQATVTLDRKSTRLNSSHTLISYALFCFKKTNISPNNIHTISLH